MGSAARPEDLDTPVLAVDLDRLERNVAAMAAACRARGLALRPHAKTHKCLEIGRMQRDAGATGLTVATVAEAEVFAAGGFDDLFLAYPVRAAGPRAVRMRGLAERVRLRVGVESAEGAAALGAALRGTEAAVLVEIDSGHHRTGVPPGEAAAVAFAATRAGLEVAGVFTFPGHGYAPNARRRAARDEAEALARAADALQRQGFDPRVRSGGSTPTVAEADAGVLTEVRPGVYPFHDAQQAELGTCRWDDVALTATATVVGARDRRIVLDAGSKVLGADRPAWASGFGRLLDHDGARIEALSEHHATVVFPQHAAPPSIGDVVRVVPNHVCAAVNLADELVVLREDVVVDRWRVAARGANT